MTICIAAIGIYEELGDFNEVIVFATDHMITLEQIGQFEHAIEKYRKINSNTIAMLSGQALLFDEVLEGVLESDNLKMIKEKIHMNMIKIREKRVYKGILNKFKLDFDQIRELLKEPKHNDTITDILNLMKGVNLKTSIILAGFEDNKAHIYEINEEGSINTRDINFDAIGTGAIQAINALLFQRHSKRDPLKKTLYDVYKAKRNAEVAQGVGKETDLFFLTSQGKFHPIKKEHLKILDAIYSEELKFGWANNNIDIILNSFKGK